MMHSKPEIGKLDAALTERERRARDRASQRLAMRNYLRKQAASTGDDRQWNLIRHGARSGESLRDLMLQDGIEAWCAVDKYKKRVGRSNATREADLDIFPGYLFVRTVPFEAAWIGVMSFEGVSGYVMNGVKPAIIRQETINEIQAFLGLERRKRKVLFAEGAMVRVVAGSFASFEGRVVTSENKRGHLKVEVDIFGRMTLCDFGIDSLRLLD